jgi:hypothetical protein
METIRTPSKTSAFSLLHLSGNRRVFPHPYRTSPLSQCSLCRYTQLFHLYKSKISSSHDVALYATYSTVYKAPSLGRIWYFDPYPSLYVETRPSQNNYRTRFWMTRIILCIDETQALGKRQFCSISQARAKHSRTRTRCEYTLRMLYCTFKSLAHRNPLPKHLSTQESSPLSDNDCIQLGTPPNMIP